MTDDEIDACDFVIRRVLDTGPISRAEKKEAMKLLDDLMAEVKRLHGRPSLKIPLLGVLNVGWKDGKTS